MSDSESTQRSDVDEHHWTIGQCATVACLLEVSTPKPGNVHRGADFEDLSLNDFLISAAVIAPVMDQAERQGVGRTVLDAVSETQRCTGRNTNLGTILLLAPLAAVPRSQTLSDGVKDVLAAMTGDDARLVYQAIQLAKPGGMGTVERMDIREEPPDRLLDAMAAAADRDLVAAQYGNGFAAVLGCSAAWIVAGVERGWSLTESIIRTQLRLMNEYPDSLISRKCGPELARQAADRAGAALDAGEPDDPVYHSALADLDFWLRSDGHRRNPGTTADLIAAGLFVAIREGRLQPPFR